MCPRIWCPVGQLQGDLEHPALLSHSDTCTPVRTKKLDGNCPNCQQTDPTRQFVADHHKTDSKSTSTKDKLSDRKRPNRRSFIRPTLFHFLLTVIIYIIMSNIRSADAYPAAQEHSCIDQKLKNPCQGANELNSSKSTPQSTLNAMETLSRQYLKQSKQAIDAYVAERWQKLYTSMEALDSEWHGKLEDANKEAWPPGNLTLEQLMIEANKRIQRSMIAMENFRRTKYPNYGNVPTIFTTLQGQLVCLLCEVRTTMAMENIEIKVDTFKKIHTDIHYKLHEYVELKTFLDELTHFHANITYINRVNKSIPH